MRAKEYPLLVAAVEEGLQFGWNRAFKHRETEPSPEERDAVIAATTDTVIDAICERFSFEDPIDTIA